MTTINRTTATATRAPAAASTALTAPPAGLKEGDTGPKVKQLQDALVALKYMTAAQVGAGAGTFGPKTEAALKKYQADHKLPSTGFYGDLTQAALKKDLAKLSGPTAPTKPETKPGVFQKPPVVNSPSPNFDDRKGADIDTIVLHHTASNNGAADLAHMRDPKAEVSAHYMVDRDGKIYQLVNDQKRAWHAGKGELHGVPTDVNGRSIGIEIVNDGGGKTPYTEAQMKSLTQLTGYLKQQYNVPMGNIVGHKDVAVPKGRKSDPSANFDWERLRKGIS
ncbi:N-acetylmuramoyl-L-alanine amidase [Hyalangium minutum]|uniref:N-acetylmuramoyl-L-alanine amidase n=1 Tax=Hyalangium minutum TaxID=394096 RepID=A0A085WAV7_9BACT|nr:N-acetylmuramoyl-L-alanine amidase [Hyalangium minutum]KFE64820.1 Negative regulator of beta-lactamase expression [Hyalangium minutum]